MQNGITMFQSAMHNSAACTKQRGMILKLLANISIYCWSQLIFYNYIPTWVLKVSLSPEFLHEMLMIGLIVRESLQQSFVELIFDS